MKIVFENTIKMATFVTLNGLISYSQIMHDDVNEYDYVVDGSGESWLLDEVKIIRVDEYTQTEILELEAMEDFELQTETAFQKPLKADGKLI